MESKLKTYLGGSKEWYNEKGQLHREDGPAVEYISGHKEWWVNGKRHREDGPAVEWPNGNSFWLINLSISYNPIMDNA